MVLYERYVDHCVAFAVPTACISCAGLISALAVDCINLSYF